VAALEWLAERTEDRAGVSVSIEVDPDSSDDRPPLEVERAAFRVALLATENAIRHAIGSSVELSLRSRPDSVALEIQDRGPGFEASEASAVHTGHRGIADMRAEAVAVGAVLSIESAAAAGAPTGTHVRFIWPTT
jgi:signal transduction histidine kinase